MSKINNINIIGNKCIFCRNCENKCPKKAIKFKENFEGFLYPEIDNEKCVNCGLCLKVCSKSSEVIKDINQETNYYFGQSKNAEVLLNSSSGGMFFEIAKYLFKKYDSMHVFGAELRISENSISLEHVEINQIDDLKRILKSKYIQSDLSSIFKRIEDYLKNNEHCLFVGTPCQCAALFKFLNKKYENLFVIDFICHGVPSKKLLNVYLEYLSKKGKIKTPLTSVDFRNKETSWENYDLKINDEFKITFSSKDNLFFKGFLSDKALRDSCYVCKFKGENRYSDITLGDFWGISDKQRDLLKNKKGGASVIVTHTDKGRNLIDNLFSESLIYPVDKSILSKNPSYYVSAKYSSKKRNFYKNLNENNLKRRCNDSILKRVLRKGITIIKKLINH